MIGSNTNNAQVTTPVTADVQNWRDSIPVSGRLAGHTCRGAAGWQGARVRPTPHVVGPPRPATAPLYHCSPLRSAPVRCTAQILAYIETGLFVAVFIAAMFRVCKCCLG